MNASIFQITPAPLNVSSGQSEMVIISIRSLISMDKALLRFTNSKPLVADLSVNTQQGDEVYSSPISLNPGRNQVSPNIGFLLGANNQEIGAILIMSVTVTDAQKNPVSQPFEVFVNIAAS